MRRGVFQLHGVDASERPILRKTLPRERMTAFSQALPATAVALKACGASHHWAGCLVHWGTRSS